MTIQKADIAPLKLGETVSSKYPVIALKEYDMGGNRDFVRAYVVIALRADHPLHPYVVWNAYKTTAMAEDQNYNAERGDYCHTLEEALERYNKRSI